MHARNVFLVGMMAVGKTTVGRQVARLLELDFEDTDRVVEERAGADISWIFDREGEAGFRHREEQAIDDCTQRDGVVLATGGGAVLSGVNRQRLRARGVVVYLKAAADMIAIRAGGDRRRPLLQVDNVRARIATLVREREPLYQQAAHVVVVSDGRSAKAVAAEVVEVALAYRTT
jgi:shikimate kinase